LCKGIVQWLDVALHINHQAKSFREISKEKVVQPTSLSGYIT